jgi:hypothetical protein
MNHLSARLLTALTVSSMIAVGHAQADFMNWSYSTAAVPPGFTASAPGNNGGGTIQLTPYSNVAGASSPNVLAYQTTATVPVTFTNDTYQLTMTIKDNTTGDTGNLTFTGSISGGLSQNSSTLVNTFANPTQSLTLDGHKYTVTLPSSTTLAAPGSNQQNIAATVSVSNASGGGGGGPPSNTPEPASLVLGGLGFSLLGMGGWWKRRRPEQRTA